MPPTQPMALTRPGMRQVQCMQCLAVAWVADGTDPHSLTWCRCCPHSDEPGHHHGQAAAACPGNGGIGHPGEPCSHPNPRVCARVSVPADMAGVSISVPVDGGEVPAMPPGIRAAGEPCPGGHCGAGVAGCTVCRPIIHHAVAGEMTLTAAG